MSTKPEETHKEGESTVIDTTGMSKGKREALELTEASREGHWAYPTFAGALFMGDFSCSSSNDLTPPDSSSVSR